ncbi:MAG: glycosyltransferase, partial [Desulfovibrionaceae bacterium]|nr:glycosyltransferase [Desulfovibrionaceae bacterium]
LEAALNCLTEINNPDRGAWLAPLMLKNHLLALLGEGAASREAGLAVLRARPWQISLGLKLYDQLFNQDTGKLPPGKTTLLLYTWNKADDLERTFSALAPGAGLLHKIVALNNGSSDHTAAVLASWSEKLANRLEVISLPVNTGAPAARNWLRSSEAVSASDFAVFLDDDALLCGAETGRWLKAFGQAISAYPEAAAYGLKITDYASPHCCQSADLHVLCRENGQALLPAAKTAEMIISGEQLSDYPPGHSHSLNRAHERSFELVNPALGAADLGLFDYIRPCASVTGCCHLFRTEKLLTHGGFNLNFSPSQCDDAERDLRLAAEGHFACYSGLGNAWHLQRTGRGRKMSPAAYGSSIANHYKLSAHFDQGRVLQIMRHQFKILEQDILRKFEALEQA